MKGFIPILICTIGVVTAGVLDNIGSLSMIGLEGDARSIEKIGAQRISEMSHEDLVRQKFILDILQHINDPTVSEELLQQIPSGAEDQLIEDQSVCSGVTGNDDNDELTHVIALSRNQKLLGKNEVFSIADEDHVRQMIGLYRLLVCCRDWETLQKNLIYARKHINGVLLVNSLLLAIRDREDTQNLIVPGLHEILPELYLDKDLLRRAQNINLNQLTSSTQTNAKTTLVETHHPGILEMIGLNKFLNRKNANDVGVQSIDRRELWMPWREMRTEIMARKTGKATAHVSIRDDDRIVLPAVTQLQGGVMGGDSSGLQLLTEDVGFQAFLQTFVNDLCLNENDVQQTNGETMNRVQKRAGFTRVGLDRNVGSMLQGGVRGQTTIKEQGLNIDTDSDRVLPVGHRSLWTQTNRKTLMDIDDDDDSATNGRRGWSQFNQKLEQRNNPNDNTWGNSQGSQFDDTKISANDEDLLYVNQRRQHAAAVNQIYSRGEQQIPNYLGVKDNEDWTRGQLRQNPSDMNMRTRFMHTLQTRDAGVGDDENKKRFDWNTHLSMGMPMDWNRQMAMHRLRAKSDDKRQGMGTRDSIYTVGNQEVYQDRKDLPEVDINDERLLHVSSRKLKQMSWPQQHEEQEQQNRFDERFGTRGKKERWTDQDLIGSGQRKNQNCIGGRCDSINKENEMENIGMHERQEMGGQWGTKIIDNVGRPWTTMGNERGRQSTNWDNDDYLDVRGVDTFNGNVRRPTRTGMNSKQCIGGRCDTIYDERIRSIAEARGMGNIGIHEGQRLGGRLNFKSRDDVSRPWTTISSERRESISPKQCIGGRCDTFNDKRTWQTTAHGMGNIGVHEAQEMGGRWGTESKDEVGRPWTTMSNERGRQSMSRDSEENIDVRGDELLNVRRPTQNWMNSKQCIGGRCDTVNDKRTWQTTQARGMGNIGINEEQEMGGRWATKSRDDVGRPWTTSSNERGRQSMTWNSEEDLDVRGDELLNGKVRRPSQKRMNSKQCIGGRCDTLNDQVEDKSVWRSRLPRSLRNSATLSSQRDIALDRAGELILHNLQQLVARINLEQISLGVGVNDELELQDDKFPSRVNNPRLINLAEERYAVRMNDMRLKTRRNRDLLDKINQLEKRLQLIIEQEVQLQTGTQQARDGRSGIEIDRIIGNAMIGKSTNSDSNLNILRILREIIIQTEGIHGEGVQKLSQTTLDIKDPIVLHLLRRIVRIADQQRQQALGAYRSEDVQMQGVNINSVTVDKLRTFVDTGDVDLVNALNTQETLSKNQRTVVARLERLNHKDFTINLDVTADRDQRVIVRTLLGPKIDTTTTIEELNEQRRNFILLDAQIVQLQTGRNQVKAKSRENNWTARDTTPFSVIYKRVMQALNSAEGDIIITGDRVQGQTCRFPHRLLLPRGRVEGLPMQMLVVITPVMENEDGIIKQWGLNQRVCGIGMGSVTMDRLPLGFPLDRPIESVQQLIALPNVHLMDVKIYHDKQVKVHDGMNDLNI